MILLHESHLSTQVPVTFFGQSVVCGNDWYVLYASLFFVFMVYIPQFISSSVILLRLQVTASTAIEFALSASLRLLC